MNCKEPDMRREIYGEDDGPYIFCVNLACPSNGHGYNLEPMLNDGEMGYLAHRIANHLSRLGHVNYDDILIPIRIGIRETREFYEEKLRKI